MLVAASTHTHGWICTNTQEDGQDAQCECVEEEETAGVAAASEQQQPPPQTASTKKKGRCRPRKVRSVRREAELVFDRGVVDVKSTTSIDSSTRNICSQ